MFSRAQCLGFSHVARQAPDVVAASSWIHKGQGPTTKAGNQGVLACQKRSKAPRKSFLEQPNKKEASTHLFNILQIEAFCCIYQQRFLKTLFGPPMLLAKWSISGARIGFTNFGRSTTQKIPRPRWGERCMRNSRCFGSRSPLFEKTPRTFLGFLHEQHPVAQKIWFYEDNKILWPKNRADQDRSDQIPFHQGDRCPRSPSGSSARCSRPPDDGDRQRT